MRHFPAFLIPLSITFLIIPLLRKLAFKFNILDIPSVRKVHTSATPRMGGIGIFLGLIVGLIFTYKDISAYLPLLVSSAVILVVGLVDDIRSLSARARLAWQLVAAMIVIISGGTISFLPSGIWGDIAEVFISLFWVLGVTNAYNYLDGLDGLAAGSAVINLLCFSIILFGTEQYQLGILNVILIFACLGFLPHNFNKATKVFLGDAGSTFLGFVLAGIALLGYWAQDNIVKITIPVLVLGVPIFDMIFTTIMRIKEAKIKNLIEWLECAGKDHFHHYLVDLGFRPIGAVVFIYCITLLLGISAIMISRGKAVEAFSTLTQAAIIFGIIATLIVVGRRHRSGWNIRADGAGKG